MSKRTSAAAYIAEGDVLDALRHSLLSKMSEWSEDNWAAGWMSRTEEYLHKEGGEWETLGRAVGWPTGYPGWERNGSLEGADPDFAWVTWDEAGRIFAERKEARANA